MDQSVFDKILKANKLDPREMTISDKLVKLSEEFGEISAAHLKELGFKPKGQEFYNEKGEQGLRDVSFESIRNNKKEEYADLLIVAIDTFIEDGFTIEEITEEMHKGVDKWYAKVING